MSKRIAVRTILINSLFLLIVLACHAEKHFDSIDDSISGIHLIDPQSTIKILEGPAKIQEPQAIGPHAKVFNATNTQILTLHLHHGSSKNSFAEFQIKYTEEGLIKNDSHTLDIKEFISGKGIVLGKSQEDIIKLLGEPHDIRKTSTDATLEYRLEGIDKSAFLKKHNLPIYYGKYIFKDNKLIEFIFGFEYP